LLAGLLGAALGLPLGVQRELQRVRAIVTEARQTAPGSLHVRAAAEPSHQDQAPLPQHKPWLKLGAEGLVLAVLGALVMMSARHRELDHAAHSPERERRACLAALPAVRYATVWQRVAAAVIDNIPFSFAGTASAFLTQAAALPAFLLGLALMLSVRAAYHIFLLFTRGQTIGSWLFRVKVLALTEDRLSLRQAFLRYSVPLAFGIADMGFLASAKLGAFYTTLWIRLALGIMVVQGVWMLANFITMLATSKHRAITDYIGQSVVVRCAD
jgi:uncharacterized RDD family membrane protein YckC